MAYVGEKPWHGLGTEIIGIPTVDEMRVAAGLDWEIVETSIYAPGSVFRKIPGYKRIARTSDGETLCISSESYKAVEVEKIFNFFRRYCEAGEMDMHTAGFLKPNERSAGILWVLAKLQTGMFELPNGDKSEAYLLMSNGYEPGFALQLDLTSVRVVCWNTLSMARGAHDNIKTRWRRVHTVEFDDARAAEARQVVENARKAGQRLHEAADLLVSTDLGTLTTDVSTLYMVELLQPNLITECIEKGTIDNSVIDEEQGTIDGNRLLNYIISEGAGNVFDPKDFTRSVKDALYCIDNQPGADMASETLWNTFNAVTYYTDHKAGRSAETRLQSAWYGEKATVKKSALELALNYTERLSLAA